MEDVPFRPHQIIKSEARPQLNNHRSSSSRHQNPDLPSAGQVAFRILCHVHTAGGVIGSSGSIIKNLETLTGSKIRFEEGIPNCPERVINIVGDAALEKKIAVGVGEEDGMVQVSRAQEGLMRVFERVLEVEGNVGNDENEDNNVHHCNGAITCRLLAQTGQIGALMGKGGKIVDGIRKSSGAKIRVLKKEQTPLCAGPEEELIQIMGGVVAVKKALVAVSCRLQDRTLGDGVPGHMSTHGVSRNLCSAFSPKENPTSLSVSDSAVEHCSLSTDIERILHVDVNSFLRKVLFKFLCSNAIAGGVIGKDGNIVKYLEKETGASIKFAPPVSGSKERVVIITSLENPDPLYSPAQIAIVRVFARCIEVGLDKGFISSLGNGESVLARILIDSSQVSCLLDGNGRVASDICVAAGSEIQLMGADDLPKCAGVNDNVVQISGDYDNVKSALFQLAGRLRENFFSGTGPKGAGCMHSSHPAIPGSSPNSKEAANSMHLAQLSKLSGIDQLDHLGLVQKSSSSHQPGLLWEQANTRKSCTRPLDSAQGMAASSGRLKHESNIGNEGPKRKVEVMVPKEVFTSVYGENGSNLARLREISGATVVLKDSCHGKSSGKVTITGTHEQIQIAQSLLHAFISF